MENVIEYIGPLDTQSQGFEYVGPLDAPKSNLPPFDIVLRPGEDPATAAKNIVSGGRKITPPGFEYVGPLEAQDIPGAGLAHTARAISETVIGLAQGMAGFLGGAATGLIDLTQSPDLTKITDKDISRAKAAAEKAAERLQLIEPQTEEAKQALVWVSQKLDPVFKTFRQIGEGPGEVTGSPALKYVGGVLAEVIGPAKLHSVLKGAKGEIRGEVAKVKESFRSTEEALKFGEEPAPAALPPGPLPKGVEYVGPLKAEIVPADSIAFEASVDTLINDRASKRTLGIGQVGDTGRYFNLPDGNTVGVIESASPYWRGRQVEMANELSAKQNILAEKGITPQGNVVVKEGPPVGIVYPDGKIPYIVRETLTDVSTKPLPRELKAKVDALRKEGWDVDLDKSEWGYNKNGEPRLVDVSEFTSPSPLPEAGAKGVVKPLAEMTNQEWQDSRHVLRRLAESTDKPDVKTWAEEQLSKYAKTHEEQVRFASQKDMTPTGNMLAEPKPTGEIPIAEGGTESRLAIRAEADAIAAKLTEDFGDLVEYKTMNMKDQANRAAEVIGMDYEAAKRMAMGTELPPTGIREATMFEAVKLRAIKEGDVDTLQKLATESTVPTRLSEYGQAIKAADSRIMDDPVKVMQDVAKARVEKAQATGAKPASPEEVTKLSQRVAELEAALAERRAVKVVEKIKNEVAKETRNQQRVYVKQELATEFDGLVKELNSVLGGQLNVGVDPMAAVILGKMAKNRVQSGIITVEGLVDSIYTAVKNMGIDLSKRDIMDAISGYGKYKQLSKDEILVQLRDLKGQMQQLSKLEDLQNRQPPLKTGVERRIPSDEERRLIKQVEEAKKKYGIQTVDPETQLKSSLDAIKTRLTNQIADLETQIASREKIVKDKSKIAYDAEALSLKEKRDGLKKQFDLIFEGPKKTPEQVALQSLKTRLKNEETRLVNKLKALDFSKKDKRVIDLDPEAEKLKAERDRAKKNYDVAAKATGTITKEEAATIVELSKITAGARTAMEQGGDRLAYGAARVAFEKYADSLKNEKQTISQMIKSRMLEAKSTFKENKVKAAVDLFKDTLMTISDNAISIVASIDNSFIGRQGLNTLMTHPSVWGPAAKASFADIYKTMASKHGGDAVKDALLADAYSMPNYLNGSYATAKLIPKTEEQYPTSLPERLPLGVGRIFKASENAFLNSGVRMRINTFDLIQDIAKKQGVDVTDKVWIKETGKLINSITARGDLGRAGDGGLVRLALWAPKMLKGNWDVLTAHTGGAGLQTPFARQQARINLLKIVGETAAVVAAVNALSPGSVETNPLSSDFLKIKVGNTRYDITAGKGSIVTLLSRAVTFKSKSTITKKTTPLNSGKYGSKTVLAVGIDFLANKTTPTARAVVDITRGETFRGTKPTVGSIVSNLTTPIGIQNFVQNFYGKDADGSVAAVVGSIVDLVGINANTYGPRKK
jgi:hypothetical protein